MLYIRRLLPSIIDRKRTIVASAAIAYWVKVFAGKVEDTFAAVVGLGVGEAVGGIPLLQYLLLLLSCERLLKGIHWLQCPLLSLGWKVDAVAAVAVVVAKERLLSSRWL